MVIAFGFVLGRALVWSCHPVLVDHSGDCIRVCVGTSSSLVPVWHVLVALLDFRFQLWFCIKFTDLFMGSVEFCLFLGLSL